MTGKLSLHERLKFDEMLIAPSVFEIFSYAHRRTAFQFDDSRQGGSDQS